MSPAAAELYVSPEYDARARAFRDAIGAAAVACPLPSPLYQPAPEVALTLAVPTEAARAALAVFCLQGGHLEISAERSTEAMQRAILSALAVYADQARSDAAARQRQADAAARATAQAEVSERLARRRRMDMHVLAIEQAAGVSR